MVGGPFYTLTSTQPHTVWNYPTDPTSISCPIPHTDGLRSMPVYPISVRPCPIPYTFDSTNPVRPMPDRVILFGCIRLVFCGLNLHISSHLIIVVPLLPHALFSMPTTQRCVGNRQGVAITLPDFCVLC